MHRDSTPPTSPSTPPQQRGLRLALAAAVLGLVLPAIAPGAAFGATTTPGIDPSAAPGAFSEQNLATDRTTENFFYRITALTHLGGGVVLGAWDARPGSSADAPNPNSIVMRRSTDNGKTWGQMTTIAAGHPADATGPRYGYSDPSFVTDREAGKVFAFFVYSKDQSFQGSQFGNDDEDRQIISAAVAESTDGGLTWSTPRSVTDVVKPGSSKTPSAGDVRGMFASSGEGIQLRYGKHRGRLIQQYAGDVQQANGTRTIQSYSVYSDDHGASWHRGAFVGTGMDENKVVELSDGRVMLNSRDSSNGHFRKIAISTDGGATYGPVTSDSQLPDPTNNAQITRMFPDAAEGSAAARKLLYTGANSQTARENVSARVSCDDGSTWPGLRTIRSGFSAYSSTTALANGRFGTFYEASYTNNLPFASYDEDWLNVVCAPLAADTLDVDAGTAATVPVTVTNQEATTLSGGRLTVSGPTGWSAKTVEVPDLSAGKSAVVDVPVTAPSTANGAATLQAVFTAADGRASQGLLSARVAGHEVVDVSVQGARTDTSRDLAADPYAAGGQVPYSFTVKHTGNVPEWVVPTVGNFAPFTASPVGQPSPAGNCRYGAFAVGASYTCSTPKHTVTAAEVADGFFVPRTTWTVGKTPAYTTIVTSREVVGDEVDLLVRDPKLTGKHDNDDLVDLDGDGYASVGDRLDTTLTIANAGNVRLTGVVAHGTAVADELGVGETAGFTLKHTLTAADIDAGTVAARTVDLAAANGSKQATTRSSLAAVPLEVHHGIDPGTPTDHETTIPGTAVLSDDNGSDTGLKDGAYTVKMNLWHGSNASLFRLYENGELVSVSKLTARTPSAQSVAIPLDGRKNGTYRYTGELVNAAGTTATRPLVVKVTDADPSRPVLGHDNYDGDGTYTLTANLWWGTNADAYRVLENGTEIASGRLTARTPAAQRVVEKVTDRSPGRYEYVVEFSNAAGTTASKPLTVRVK